MVFFRGRKRKRLLSRPLTDAQRALLQAAAPLCAALPEALRARHEGIVQVLLAEKHFEGAGGFALREEHALIVAGQAALLQMHAGADYFRGLDTVLIYPEAFVVRDPQPDPDGFVVHEGDDERAGESWQRGAVVLSWQDVDRESRERDGYNVVLHEFAHQLDEQDGGADGTPLLPSRELVEQWPEVFQAAFETHQRALRRRRPVLFDDNAAESPAEFFATAVELFFEYPRDLGRAFPDVYRLLAEYLELDPASWSTSG
jgi:Mlc titration factor MtfA (ptsG expression regulator)